MKLSPKIATGWVLKRRKTCGTPGEGTLWSFGPLCDACELQAKRTLPFLTGRKLPMRHWQVKIQYSPLYLPRH